jgi:hypothetical protein
MPAHLLPSGSNHGESGTLEAAAVKTESVTLEAKKASPARRKIAIASSSFKRDVNFAFFCVDNRDQR